jgi:Carboxypeptidase regulatory-like domain
VLRNKAVTIGFLASMLFPLVAHAQGGAQGSILGYVFDQTGNPIRGVKVTASSPTQIGGSKTGYTNDEGFFRFAALFPGTFEVRATAPKLRTYIQKDVKVGISAAAEVSIVMEVEQAGVEEVKVVEKAPTVSTTTSNVKEVYDLDFVESMPFNSRDQVFNQMVSQIGGAVGTRMRGGAGNQTIFTQDGFDMRDQYPVTKASAAYEIQSAGYGADNAAASGGLVNLVTKTGSNKWEAEFNATYEDNWLRLGKDNRDSPGNFYYLVNPAFAGPIVKDKLWFAMTFELHWLGRGRDPDALGIISDPLPYRKGINKGTLKVTWQMNSRNKLSYLMNIDSAWETNMRDGLGIEQEAQTNRRAGLSGLWGLIWESLLSDNLILRVQGAYSRRPQHWYPWNCDHGAADTCDFIAREVQKFPRTIESKSGEKHERWDLDVFQVAGQLQYFVSGKGIGEHNFQLKNSFYTEQETRRFSVPGDALIEYNQGPEAMTTYYSNDPRYETPRYGFWIATDTITRNNTALSDSWRPTRHVTLTPAISYIWARGYNGAGDTVIDSKSFAPSITGAWDATHDGRTVLRSSFSNYVDVAIRDAVLTTLGTQANQKCLWNADTKAFDKSCVFGGGLSRNTIGSPCGPSGLNPDGSSCIQPLSIPRTYEATVGAEREIVQGVGLAVDVIYRKFTHQYETRETNQIWNPSGEAIVGYRNGRAEKISDLTTPAGANRSYQGITAALNKREGQVKVYVSYTLAKLEGNVWDGLSNPWGDIPARDAYLWGPGPDDHRHDIKASMQFQATKWLSAGIRYNFQTGFPYNRLFRNDATGSNENYRSQIGSNPGTNLNDPGDDRPLRVPDKMELSAQVRVSMLPLIGHKLDFYVDALNILNARTPTSYTQNDGPTFGVESGWQAPFRMRFGLNYKY